MRLKKLTMIAIGTSLTAFGCTQDSDPSRDAPSVEDELAEVDATEIAMAAAERESWGLPADHATVEGLLRSPRDVGTEEWGIAMTEEEALELDLPGRTAFASAIKRDAVPFVNSLATSGGVYIDQANDGGLVVLLTEPSAEVEDEIFARLPSDSRGFRIEKVTHTELELRQSLARAWQEWASVVPAVALEGAGLDIVRNRVLFEVESASLADARSRLPQLERALGVRVGVEAVEDHTDTTCTSRDHCVSPSKAGTRIYKGAIDNVNECTMAFHVIGDDGDVEFVTAGHCGYGGSNNWYLKDGTGNGLFLGAETKSLYHNNGQDIMRVNLPTGQKSHKVYGESRVYGGSGGCPVTGQVACASRGTSNVVDCGTVRTTWTSWVSNTASPDIVVWGGDLNNVGSNPGDSGSPVFDKLDSEHWGTVGVLDTSAGGFAVLCKAESGLEITGLAY